MYIYPQWYYDLLMSEVLCFSGRSRSDQLSSAIYMQRSGRSPMQINHAEGPSVVNLMYITLLLKER